MPSIYLTVDKVVKRYAYLRRLHPELHSTVFHSTRKWFITQCERTGVPEHFTATLVGHHSARSANKLTYGLYSAGISDAQKREIVEGIRLHQAKKMHKPRPRPASLRRWPGGGMATDFFGAGGGIKLVRTLVPIAVNARNPKVTNTAQ